MKFHITPKIISGIFISAAAMLVLASALDRSMAEKFEFAAAGAVIAYIIPAMRATQNEKRRNRSYDMDIPDIMVHAAMFIESGLGIWDAIERSVSIEKTNRPLYKDISEAFARVRKGASKDIISAFEELAETRGSSSLSDFCAVIIQNVRKGSAELSSLLTSQAQLYRNERRRTVGKLADEAATLLVIPSTIVLIALILLLVAPAIMEIFSII